MALLVTVLIVAVCISAAAGALAGAMQVASNLWVRSGGHDVVRGAESLLRSVAGNPA
jgi:hypothetical protein